jgi:hypothetical protein
VNVEQWRAEARRLSYLPGARGVRWQEFRAFLDTERGLIVQRASVSSLRPPNMVVRRMGVRERMEMHEGRLLDDKAQILRCGRRRYYVIEPDRHHDARVRVY